MRKGAKQQNHSRKFRGNKPRRIKDKIYNKERDDGKYVLVRDSDKYEIDNTKIQGFVKVVDLTYNDSDTQRTSPTTFLVFSYRVTDVYDPDPLLLTGGVTGYPEMIKFFDNWRVKYCTVECQMTNQEPIAPIQVGVVINPQNLVGVISTRAAAVNALERPGTLIRSIIVPPKGGADKSPEFSFSINPSKVWGDRSTYKGSLNFIGAPAASPAQPIWVNFILIGPTTVNLTNGLFCNIKLTYTTKFFNVTNSLLSSRERETLFLNHQKELQENIKDQVKCDYLRRVFKDTLIVNKLI
jgi:hypothetical protein